MKWLNKAIVLLLIPIGLSGQKVPATNQYILNPIAINPAMAGNSGFLTLAALYNKQWVGVNGSPSTVTFSADMPVFNDRIGLGLLIMNDNVGVTSENQIVTDYAYRLQVGKGTLSLGIGAGIITTNTAWSELDAIDNEDEYLLIDSKPYVVPQFSFGVYYRNQGFFSGISLPGLLNYRWSFDKSKYEITSNASLYDYLLYTGYSFRISRRIKLTPSTLLSFVPETGFLYDLNGSLGIGDRFVFGLSYQSNRAITGLFKMQINNQLSMGYSYDYEISNLGHYSNGSHLIMLKYEFRYRVEAVNSLIF